MTRLLKYSLFTEYLDLTILKKLKLEAEKLGDWTKLAEKLASVFSQAECLSSSFLQVGYIKMSQFIDYVFIRHL